MMIDINNSKENIADAIYDDPISVRDAADILGISSTRVQQLKQEGKLASDQNGKLSQADVLMFSQDRLGNEKEQSMDLSTAIEKKKIAEAELTELKAKLARIELAEKRGDLISTEKVIEDATNTANQLKQMLDTIPMRLATLLVNKDERFIFKILASEIELIKEAIHSGRFVLKELKASS